MLPWTYLRHNSWLLFYSTNCCSLYFQCKKQANKISLFLLRSCPTPDVPDCPVSAVLVDIQYFHCLSTSSNNINIDFILSLKLLLPFVTKISLLSCVSTIVELVVLLVTIVPVVVIIEVTVTGGSVEFIVCQLKLLVAISLAVNEKVKVTP